MRLLSILSLIVLVTLVALTIWSWYQPLELMFHDPDDGSWFSRNYAASQIEDLDEPSFGGRYPNPAWDVGLFPFVLYVRQSEYISTQIVNAKGEWIDNPDYDNYEKYQHHLLLGILWKRVWHQGQTSAFVAVPSWLLFLSFSILPVWRLLKFVRSRRTMSGFCPTCNYDLRAHHRGDKCPECGTPIAFPPSRPGVQ